MPNISISFVGVCIHVIRDGALSGLPSKRRVILLRSQSGKIIHGHGIEPHVPTLQLPQALPTQPACMTAQRSTSQTLQGVAFRVTNASPVGIVDQTGNVLTHLTPPGSSLTPNIPVIVNGALPAVGYFDWSDGTLKPCQATPSGAIGTSLTIETTADPILEIKCFNGTTTNVTFPSGAALAFTNSAPPGKDDDFDFLLSYEVCETIPDDTVTPHHVTTRYDPCTARTYQDMGPSCSNSLFP